MSTTIHIQFIPRDEQTVTLDARIGRRLLDRLKASGARFTAIDPDGRAVKFARDDGWGNGATG